MAGVPKRAGGLAIAESRESSAVFGMPRQAIEQGVVDQVLAKEWIATAIANAFGLVATLESPKTA